MEQKCIFCNVEQERREGNILFESDNFYVEIVKFGPFSPGHVLLISKFHLSSFGALPPVYEAEFLDIIASTKKQISEAFAAPIYSEMGVYGQSIKHAHIHFFPAQAEHYNIYDMSAIVPSQMEKIAIPDLDVLRQLFQSDGQYITVEQNDQLYAWRTRGYSGPPVRLRDLFVMATRLEEFQKWQSFPDDLKAKTLDWIKMTKEALKA